VLTEMPLRRSIPGPTRERGPGHQQRSLRTATAPGRDAVRPQGVRGAHQQARRSRDFH